MGKSKIIRAIDVIFCCIFLVSSVRLIVSGRSAYKGVHQEGIHIRLLGGMLLASGLYLLFTTRRQSND